MIVIAIAILLLLSAHLTAECRVFLSHSGEDSRLAAKLAERLLASNASVVWDHEFVPGGEFISSIRYGIDRAQIVLVLIGDGPISAWIGFEIGYAAGRGKRVVPVIASSENWMKSPVFLRALTAVPEARAVAAVTRLCEGGRK